MSLICMSNLKLYCTVWEIFSCDNFQNNLIVYFHVSSMQIQRSCLLMNQDKIEILCRRPHTHCNGFITY